MSNWQSVDDHEVEATQDETARAIYELAAQVGAVARALHALGNGNAATPMGAIEAFGKHMGEKMDALTSALEQPIVVALSEDCIPTVSVEFGSVHTDDNEALRISGYVET